MICLKKPDIRNLPGAVAGTEVWIGKEVRAFTLRVADAAGAGVAYSIALRPDVTVLFHFAADEAWTEREVVLSDTMDLTVFSAAGSIIELIVWE